MNDHAAAPRISGPFAPVGAVVGGVVGGVIGGVIGHYVGESAGDWLHDKGVDRVAASME